MKTGRRVPRGRKRWEQRWKNRRPDGTYVSRGTNWTASRSQVCPHCGRRYYWFRMPISREDVLFQLQTEANRGNIPCVTLRTLLGRCHEYKMRAWEAHIELCGWVDPIEGMTPDPEDVQRLAHLETITGYFVMTDRKPKVK